MVVVVMGVSGAGKTTVGRALAARLGWRFEDADDWHPPANVAKMRRGEPLTDADRRPWMAALAAAVTAWTAEGRHVVLACSALHAWQRDVLRDAGPVRLVHLRGTFDDIDARLRARSGHFMPESLLASQLAALEEPGPGEALVVDARLPVATLVSAIVTQLGLPAPA
jgi:gluconokinase